MWAGTTVLFGGSALGGRGKPAADVGEDGNVPRSRYWIVTALLLVIGVSAPIIAQDKGKTPDKGGDKAKADTPKAADTPAATGDKVELKWKFEKDKPFYQAATTKTQQDMKVM